MAKAVLSPLLQGRELKYPRGGDCLQALPSPLLQGRELKWHRVYGEGRRCGRPSCRGGN